MLYRISRGLLQLAVVIGFLFLCLAGLLYWPLALVFLGASLCKKITQRHQRWTTLGSARWANEEDLSRAGMLDATSGLILGKFYVGRSVSRAVAKLFSKRLLPAQACHEFLSSLRHGHSVTVRLPQAIHTAIFSPSGQGKGVSGVIPFLLDTDESCIVVDFKGENAALTAAHRRSQFHHQCVILDPFKRVTDAPDTFNPLDFIDADDPLALDACQDLAKALVIRSPDEREPHFNDAAEMWIAAIMAIVVHFGDRSGVRSLQTMREFLSDPRKLEKAVELMNASEVWGGMLARMGGQLRHFIDKEKSSTLTTVGRHLRFLDTLAIAANTQTSSFDPARLRSGKMTIYLVLPPEHMRSQSPLLRLWIGSLLRSIVRTGLNERNKVHVILDEMASVGQLDAIEDAVDKYRGYGIRLQLYFQSMGQLKKCFPNGQEQTLLSNTSQVYFAVNDSQTAEMISSRLGDSTIIVESGGSGSGNSWQNGGNAAPSSTYSNNFNRNWTQQARRLLKPEEVIAIDPRLAITLTPGVKPVCTRLIRYYEEPTMGKEPTRQFGLVSALNTFFVSLLFVCFSLAFAFVIATVANSMSYQPSYIDTQTKISETAPSP
jgi:type IV secretion system protein VirD4